MYNTTIDIELFFLLVKSMHPDLLSLALDVRAQHGPFGSQLYRVLEARFGTMDGQGLDSDIDHQYSLLSSSKSEESAITVSATVNGQSKSREFTSVQSGIDIRDYPILRQDTWPAWQAKLLRELSTNWTALGILNGSIEEGHPSYDSGIDEDLHCLIRFTALESYEKIVDDTEAQHGRKGRKLYAALKREVQASQRALFDLHVQMILGDKRQGIEKKIKRLNRLQMRAQKYDINFTHGEMQDFVKAIASRSPEAKQAEVHS